MTAYRDLKRIIRERQKKTGESYTAARAYVMRARAEMLGLSPPAAEGSGAERRVDAVVLKVNRQSVRVRVFGEEGQLTFRSPDAWEVAPGQVVTLVGDKRWTWRGDAYGSGAIEDPRIDIARLGLEPLPLKDGPVEDLRATYEPYRDPEFYAPLWRELTAEPRACFEMDPIAWGAFPSDDPDSFPVCDASELFEAGDAERARDLLMATLLRDLRCLDAHAHLGHIAFERSPERAAVHYEIGMRIGELSLPRDFDGVLLWGRIYNRPFLRCLHGYGLCLWRLGRPVEAQRVFLRILALNPNDNQGVRSCWRDVREGRPWEQAVRSEEPGLHAPSGELVH